MYMKYNLQKIREDSHDGSGLPSSNIYNANNANNVNYNWNMMRKKDSILFETSDTYNFGEIKSHAYINIYDLNNYLLALYNMPSNNDTKFLSFRIDYTRKVIKYADDETYVLYYDSNEDKFVFTHNKQTHHHEIFIYDTNDQDVDKL